MRPLTETDATETYASWLRDTEVNKFLATKHATVESQREFIALKNAQKNAELFGIFLREDTRHIGTIKLEPIDLIAKKATIGIMIGDKREWGKGLAAEAMQLVIAHCFNDLSLTELELGVLAQNRSALRVYEKLGFVETDRKIGAVKYENGVFDQVEMSLKLHA